MRISKMNFTHVLYTLLILERLTLSERHCLSDKIIADLKDI